MATTEAIIAQHIPFLQKIKIKLFRLFRLHIGPAIKLYRGFGNETTCVIFGHALSLSPLPRKTYRKFFVYNSVALLRLFMVKPRRRVKVKLQWESEVYETITQKDGLFRFEWKPTKKLLPGTYPVKAFIYSRQDEEAEVAFAESEVIVPSPTDYTFISDIDDTFLISHSTNLRKRLFVLLTENARSRCPFEGVVQHYRLLHGADDELKENNTFFYVSSSEWNLYDYIHEFIRANKLPEGIFLLNQMKTFSKLFATGQGNHSGKFTRIIRIIEAYPDRKFVLLGDDSQMDIDIYTSVVEHFPQNIFCIYLRRVGAPQKPHVLEKQKIIEQAGVLFCYFANSEDGIQHSREIGLVK